jgi:hypothetical protein
MFKKICLVKNIVRWSFASKINETWVVLAGFI